MCGWVGLGWLGVARVGQEMPEALDAIGVNAIECDVLAFLRLNPRAKADDAPDKRSAAVKEPMSATRVMAGTSVLWSTRLQKVRLPG
jgi:hypothetical protein